MAVSQPITNVGGINGNIFQAFLSEETEIRNSASGVFIAGQNTAQIGNALITPYSIDADLFFRLPKNADNNPYRLDFGDKQTLTITNVGGINSLVLGSSSIENTAQAISFNGSDYGFVGSPIVTPYEQNANLYFEFVNADDKNKTRLDFDEKKALVITNAGNISSAFGNVDKYLQSVFRPVGIYENGIGNAVITHSVNNGINADLIFRLPETLDLNKNRLDFGDTSQLTISTVGGFDACQFGGDTYIQNTAQSVNIVGSDFGVVGNAFIFKKTTPIFEDQFNAASVNLYFTRRELGLSAANIPLPFNTEKRIKPQGFSVEFGQASIFNKTQYISPDSTLLHDEIGYHKLREPYAPSILILQSIDDIGGVGRNHQVISWRQNINVGGFDAYSDAVREATELNDLHGHSIMNRNQFVNVGGKDYAVLGNSAWISNYEREIEIQTGINTATIGKAWIDYGQRRIDLNLNMDGISPPNIPANAHSIGGSQTISPVGWESTEWLTRIVPERQTLYSVGWNSQEKGQIEEQQEHKIFNETQKITFKYYDAIDTLHGTAFVYNARQYIDIGWLENGIAPIDETDPHYKQKWHKIANVNREIGVYGIDSEKHSKKHYIKNTAKRIDGVGSVLSEWGNAFIAHAVRYIDIDTAGIPPFTMSRWHAIYNAASGIYPVGFDSLNTGKAHKIENTRRYYRWIGLGEQTEWGTPFIDFAVRELHPYRITPEYLDKPTVFNSDQYIEPESIESVWGKIEVKETRNIISVETLQSGEKSIGYPERVYNFNKEIHRTGGFDACEFGFNTTIDNWKKYIYIDDGISGGFVAKPIYIGDNTQRLYLGGLWSEKQSYQHKVIQGVSPPYSTQQIILTEILDGNGNVFTKSRGIAPIQNQVGTPKLTDNTIRTKQDSAFTALGGVTIYCNCLKIESGIYTPFDIGTPFIKHNQTISLDGYGIAPDEINQVSKPRLSPNTIYAPSSDMASSQAKRNHPTNHSPNIIGYLRDTVIEGYKFGSTTITNQHRTVYIDNTYYKSAEIGNAKIFNDQNIISVKGWKPERFGLAEIPHDQEIELPTRNTKVYTEFGKPEIYTPQDPTQYIKPKGIDTLHGKTEIQKFNREVYIVGFDSLRMGASNNTDKCYMPQSLWIGFPIPTIIEGNEFTGWGNAWISNFIQEIKTVGSDMLQMRYDRTKFRDRMYIKRLSPEPPPK